VADDDASLPYDDAMPLLRFLQRFLNAQVGVSARYVPRRDVALEAWASRLRVAGPLERAGARDTTFFAGIATWSF